MTDLHVIQHRDGRYVQTVTYSKGVHDAKHHQSTHYVSTLGYAAHLPMEIAQKWLGTLPDKADHIILDDREAWRREAMGVGDEPDRR